MTQIQFKPEVRLSLANLGPWTIRILRGAVETAPPLQGGVLVVTSATDGVHGLHSLHPRGAAFDFRCFGARPGAIGGDAWGAEGYQLRQAQAWVERLRKWLGPGYDVILESDHVHAEHDPK